MMLSDIRDYIAGLDIAEQCYMGKLDAKKENSIGSAAQWQQSYTTGRSLQCNIRYSTGIHIDSRKPICSRNRTNGA